jgi:uncharacterized RDD family membrane protein YckC
LTARRDVPAAYRRGSCKPSPRTKVPGIAMNLYELIAFLFIAEMIACVVGLIVFFGLTIKSFRRHNKQSALVYLCLAALVAVIPFF